VYKRQGIVDEEKKFVFDRRERSERPHTGIGLSLVKVLVDRSKGTIEVKDRIEGDSSTGARFVIDLPLGS
jgi:signal transduction histidine kinase